jgi:hypothetical protein
MENSKTNSANSATVKPDRTGLWSFCTPSMSAAVSLLRARPCAGGLARRVFGSRRSAPVDRRTAIQRRGVPFEQAGCRAKDLTSLCHALICQQIHNSRLPAVANGSLLDLFLA